MSTSIAADIDALIPTHTTSHKRNVCCPEEGHCEIRCEIQGGSQEMAVMVG